LRDEMRDQAVNLARAEEAALTRLTGIGEAIEATTAGLVDATERAMERARSVGAEFDSQAASLSDSVTEGARRVAEAGEAFRDQTGALIDAAEAAAAEARRLSGANGEDRRQAFLRSASRMIEDLNAAALDLNRILAEDIPEEVWKRYRRGDRSVFARRLLRGRDRLDLPILRERCTADAAFRDEATRYVTQFETLLSQATDCDPEHVLSTTFLTADVGKLYLMLSRSLGRTQ